ncbi:IS4 family transposase [Terasakiella sp. A23]|uniref:IS4 family transposase n=1 Tax=Terasakiella sp. FCG-A23 TaxID=3080561 RepID=UPI0029533936|nr:IS4 family transposase [Terasakiella sp. A23]MDV7341562.1 IS4 family transposase [Terasakiella sp. A23]
MFSNSTFGDVLKLLPRDFVSKSVERHDSDRWRKTFKTWDHLVALLTAQFSGVSSLRDLETLLHNAQSQHYHLGIRGVKRSTLSDANNTRSAAVFGEIAQRLIQHTKHQKSEMQEVLSVLDSSLICLNGRGYEWAKKTQARGAPPGLKLHVQMAHGTGCLEHVEITPANVNDITQAQTLPLEAGHTYVFDKGYVAYKWWHQIMEKRAAFVSRLKCNAHYEVVEDKPISEPDKGHILRDQIITLSNKHPRGRSRNPLAGQSLRLIEIPHPAGKKRPFLIVSSHLEAPPL